MERRTPVPDAPAIDRDASGREILFNLRIRVITPMFGGSAAPREVDVRVPVRATSVRGHLRFWWRVCKSAGCATVEELFKEEEALWGSTDVPSTIHAVVETLSRGKEVACATLDRSGRPNWEDGYPGYALFPFKGDEKAEESQTRPSGPAVAREGVEFRLRLEVDCALAHDRRDKAKKAAEAALWAWLTFGGVGARTRRGCGSLFCADAPFSMPGAGPTALAARLTEQAATYVASGSAIHEGPALRGARIIVAATPPQRPSMGPAKDAWVHAVGLLEQFRQSPVGRPTKFGKTRWPEANSIRSLDGDDEGSDYYPRADLGLPIIFQFPQEKRPQHRIQPGRAQATRMASPLIVKALGLLGNNAATLVVCLTAPHVWELGAGAIELENMDTHAVTTLSPASLHDPARAQAVPPLRQYGETARDAFMAYAAQVTRGVEARFV
jgi:CRISPR-associated protein Cmr1